MWGFDDKEYYENELKFAKAELSSQTNELARLRTENRKLREENERLTKLYNEQLKANRAAPEQPKCERCRCAFTTFGGCMCLR